MSHLRHAGGFQWGSLPRKIRPSEHYRRSHAKRPRHAGSICRHYSSFESGCDFLPAPRFRPRQRAKGLDRNRPNEGLWIEPNLDPSLCGQPDTHRSNRLRLGSRPPDRRSFESRRVSNSCRIRQRYKASWEVVDRPAKLWRRRKLSSRFSRQRGMRQRPEAALPGAEFRNGGGEVGSLEIRPHHGRENQFGVSAFPQQKIAEALFTAGADQ